MSSSGGRTWWRWLVLALAVLVVGTVVSRFTNQQSGTDKLINQLWVERLPRDARDLVWNFVVLDRGGGQHLGVLGRSSKWRVNVDRLTWKQEGDRLTIVTPQNGCRSTLRARTWKCAGEAPKPFELCLEMESAGKKYRYYSRTGWAIKPKEAAEVEGEMAFAAPALQAALLAAPAGDAEDGAAGCEGLDGP